MDIGAWWAIVHGLAESDTTEQLRTVRETVLRKHWYDLCQRMFCPCSLLVVLWCHVLCLSLQPFWVLFLWMVRGCVLTPLIYMQQSNFPSTTWWRNCLFPRVYSCLLCQKLIDHSAWVYFWALCSVPLIHMSGFVHSYDFDQSFFFTSVKKENPTFRNNSNIRP